MTKTFGFSDAVTLEDAQQVVYLQPERKAIFTRDVFPHQQFRLGAFPGAGCTKQGDVQHGKDLLGGRYERGRNGPKRQKCTSLRMQFVYRVRWLHLEQVLHLHEIYPIGQLVARGQIRIRRVEIPVIVGRTHVEHRE